MPTTPTDDSDQDRHARNIFSASKGDWKRTQQVLLLAFEHGMITAEQTLGLFDRMQRLGLHLVPLNPTSDDPNWR